MFHILVVFHRCCIAKKYVVHFFKQDFLLRSISRFVCTIMDFGSFYTIFCDNIIIALAMMFHANKQ